MEHTGWAFTTKTRSRLIKDEAPDAGNKTVKYRGEMPAKSWHLVHQMGSKE